MFVGVAGAHHHDVGAFFLEAQQGIPEFEVFIEIFGENGDAFAFQTFFQRHDSTSLNRRNWKKDKDSRQAAQGKGKNTVDFASFRAVILLPLSRLGRKKRDLIG